MADLQCQLPIIETAFLKRTFKSENKTRVREIVSARKKNHKQFGEPQLGGAFNANFTSYNKITVSIFNARVFPLLCSFYL